MYGQINKIKYNFVFCPQHDEKAVADYFINWKWQEYGSTSLTKEQARKLMNHLSELIAKMNDK